MTREGGSATVLAAALVAVVAIVATATAALGVAYAARAQAQSASDASALAAAVATYPPAADAGPLARARSAASANGAVLVWCRCPIDGSLRTRVVTVVTAVALDVPVFGRLEVRAASRAEFDPLRWLGP